MKKKERSGFYELSELWVWLAILGEVFILITFIVEGIVEGNWDIWDKFLPISGGVIGFFAACYALIYAISKKTVRVLLLFVLIVGYAFLCWYLLAGSFDEGSIRDALIGATGMFALFLWNRICELYKLLVKAYRRVVRTEMRLKRLERYLNALDKDVSGRRNS